MIFAADHTKMVMERPGRVQSCLWVSSRDLMDAPLLQQAQLPAGQSQQFPHASRDLTHTGLMQEEERERRMDYVPDESAVSTEHIEVPPSSRLIDVFFCSVQ